MDDTTATTEDGAPAAAVACRACGHSPLEPVLSLGQTPLANSLLRAEDLGRPEATFPLDLAFCTRCSLVQITESVSPTLLFSEYLYFSSFSDTMVGHARALAERLTRERHLGAGSLVIEAASNDGYLLKHYRDAGVPVLGIEPARNIAEVAVRAGVPTRAEFFTRALGERLRDEGLSADLFHAHNVLAHVPDLRGFVGGVRQLLKRDGRAVIEAPYVREMIDRREFDTIYHEHLCYFSLTALDRLFTASDLTIVDVERVPIHGGSLRLFAAPGAGAARDPRALALLAEEERDGVAGLDYYRGFAAAVQTLRLRLRALLEDLKGKGKRIAAYGAAAKGSTLLNYSGIGRELIDFVADRSGVKQGRFMPGVHLPVVAPDEILARQPDYVLLLTWNFADEILAQQAEYRRRGGRFIIPIPEPVIL